MKQELSESLQKGSNPKAPRISEKMMAILHAIRKNSNAVFGNYTLVGFSNSYYRQQKKQKRLALKLQNPRINQISLHTFRNWKATMEYHRTKDILYVIRLLGRFGLVVEKKSTLLPK